MALTYGAPTVRSAFGKRFLIILPVTLDNSYPTGGYSIDQTIAGQLPVASIGAVLVAGISQSAVTASFDFQYNATTSKLQAFGGSASGAAAAEAANTTDLSAYTVNLVVIGQ